MADFENITLDQCYELPIMQVFNDLVYLKAKRKFEEDIIKKR